MALVGAHVDRGLVGALALVFEPGECDRVVYLGVLHRGILIFLLKLVFTFLCEYYIFIWCVGIKVKVLYLYDTQIKLIYERVWSILVDTHLTLFLLFLCDIFT